MIDSNKGRRTAVVESIQLPLVPTGITMRNEGIIVIPVVAAGL